MAVIASTLTTVAVFFPMVFVSGIAGQLFRDQALTVTFALMLSLLVGADAGADAGGTTGRGRRIVCGRERTEREPRDGA